MKNVVEMDFEKYEQTMYFSNGFNGPGTAVGSTCLAHHRTREVFVLTPPWRICVRNSYSHVTIYLDHQILSKC